MSDLTWREFKEHIDILMEKEGISQDTEIWCIDFSWPSAKNIGIDDGGQDCPSVSLDEKLGILIQ